MQDIFNVYRCAVWGRINNRSRQCFPNTHALQEGVGQVVVPMEDLDLHNAYERKAYNSNEYQTILEELSDVLLTLPEELRLALELLIQDFTGVSCIEQKKGKRLKAGKERIEPLSVALARKAKLDLHRDPIAELASWLKIETTAEE